MKKFQQLQALAAVTAMTLVSAPAFAEVDISAEVAEAKTDILTAGALIIGVVLAVVAFNWVRRVIK